MKNEETTSSIQSFLPPLKTFKITRNQLIKIDEDYPNTKKLILQTGFSDIQKITTLKVYMYHTESHSYYARAQKPTELPDDTEFAYNVPEKFILSNTEIDFRQIRKELKHGNTWDTDFTHIRLRAKVITWLQNDFLVYALDVINNNAVVSAYVVPAESNPSPPKTPID